MVCAALLRTVTLALGTTIPDESEMVPDGDEVSDWADGKVAAMMRSIMTTSAMLHLWFFTCGLRGRLQVVYDCAITILKCLHSLVSICQQ